MAYNNAWANLRLLNACRALTNEEFQATRTSFFPSLSQTLNHNYTVDLYYIDALERSLDGVDPNLEASRFFEPEIPFPECPRLAAAQRNVDQRLIAACERVHDESLDLSVAIPRRAGIQHESVTRLLAHLFQHQIHHRGQAHAMLAGTSVKPPPLDEFFCAGEAHLRAKELTELGTSESNLWNK